MVPEDGSGAVLPSLPLDAWEDTKETLHRYAQVVGKIRLSAAPFKNHWWHVTLYVGARGLTMGPIPYGRTNFELELDLLNNRLEARAGNGGSFGFALDDLAVADFYRKLMEGLAAIGVEVSIDPRPFDLDDEHPLDENFLHHACDREYVRRYWQILVWVDGVFQVFAGRFNGKQSPVHLFWHSFDLALARFSGGRARTRRGRPRHPGGLLARGHLLRFLARRQGRAGTQLLLLHGPRAAGPDGPAVDAGVRALAARGRHGEPLLRGGAPEQRPRRDPPPVSPERLRSRRQNRGLEHR
ncbi:MAG TPA: DUF5996 family protein [Rubrobacter sp.]|nr:DUF5996 family protein [Rubrobacter sp.]